jgi:hypothetical protein
MFIRSITTTAILLACAAAHAQAVAPMANAALQNDTVDIGKHFHSAEPNPNAQQPYGSFQFSAVEERAQDGRYFSQNPEVFPQFNASLPPLFLNGEDDPPKEVYTNTQMEMDHPSITRYYNQAQDFPPHVAPQVFQPGMQSHANAEQPGDPRLNALSYREFPAVANSFFPAEAPKRSQNMSFHENSHAWSCIAINGEACPPSMHRAA